MASTNPQILRPIPRRPFQQSNDATSSMPPSPLLSPAAELEPPSSVSRTHSILNLTSSTLLGIYSPTGYSTDRDEPSTPWGTNLETPSPRRPELYRTSSGPLPTAAWTQAVVFTLILRSTLLFGMGMLYGLLVRHLHDDRQLAPFQVEGILKPSHDWKYLVFWGVAGVALGSLLPWVDLKWEQNIEEKGAGRPDTERRGSIGEPDDDSQGGILGSDWTPAVRSLGAFVGIAFAIRKLPWASTLQASITLALVNPVLWYLIDRSTAGFVMSIGVGATGTAVVLLANPDMMPSPASPSRNATTLGEQHAASHLLIGNYVQQETFEGGIWILSVLFCSCVCFGNIGRRLALNRRVGKTVAGSGRRKSENYSAQTSSRRS
ncbi:INSIG domain-containing protein [Phlyctema vagabunda]|uniref:INSIG domain-containing protein n=1 Tax=Phlyctema vagabunda TaxID=108571 RepID=A0ABR4P4F6_9HELO